MALLGAALSLHAEILQQPEVLRGLLNSAADAVNAVARAVADGGIEHVYLAARGTSDNAGRYAKYVWGSLDRLPVALAAPSLFSVYRRPPRLRGALVVGISQSGQSPDIVSVLTEAARQGAATLAITNDAASPLAKAARYLIDTRAGREEAVAATKTYTAQLMAIALLGAAMAADDDLSAELERVPGWVEEALALEGRIESAVERYRSMDRCVVLGRGYNYATAYEWSLKLEELTYVVAEPYSPSDFQHGPVAIVDRGFPVFATAVRGAVFEGTRELMATLREAREVELLALSNDDEALALAQTPLALPSDLVEWLSPLVAIVPAQLFCYHLARAKGCDTEVPRGLSKVTRTV